MALPQTRRAANPAEITADKIARNGWLHTFVMPSIVTLTLVGLAAAGYLIGFREIRQANPSYALSVDPRYLDFGVADSQPRFSWTLPIQNISSHPVEVVGMRVSCACASVTPNKFIVEPGATVSLGMRLDLTNSHADAESQRAFAVELAPVIKSGPPSYPSWRIRGQVRSPVVCSPSRLSFGDSLVQGASFPSGVVQVKFPRPVREVQAHCPSSLGAATVNVHNGGYKLVFQPSDELPVGKFEGEISWRATLEDGNVLNLPPLPICGQVCLSVAASPPVLLLGAGESGTLVQSALKIRSRIGRPIRVLNTSKSRANDQVELVSVSSDQSEYLYRVSRRQTAAHLDRGTLDFLVVDDSSSDGPKTLTVEVLSQGIE